MESFLTTISLALSVVLFAIGFLLSLWWIWIPWLFFVLARDLWLKWRRTIFINGLDWALLEVTPPKNMKKTARAMEQFFAGLHGIQGSATFEDKYWKGKVQTWASMEMVSFGGEIRFLVRVESKFRNLAESHIYGQYPEAEIRLASDYVHAFPDDIPNEEYTLWGTEYILSKEDAYPIRTYLDFEKDIVLEEQRIDPLSSLFEVMSKLTSSEQIWIQMLVRPVGDQWRDDGIKLRDGLLGRKEEKKPGLIKKETVAWKDASKVVAHKLIVGGPPADQTEEAKDKEVNLSLGEREVIKAIEKNISKLGFETVIRFVYLAQKDVFNRSNVNAINGAYKQFNDQILNGLKPNSKISPDIDYVIQIKDQRELYRAKRIYNDYQKREFVQYSKYIPYMKELFLDRLPILNWFLSKSRPFTFSIEELATVYHFPAEPVKAPLIPKVEARKAEPPIGLPVG